MGKNLGESRKTFPFFLVQKSNMKATIQSTDTKLGKEFVLSKCNARVGESLPFFI
jgi:hypothetical protein